MAAADAAPSASWAFFEAAFSVDDDEEDEDEAKRRGALVRSRVRHVVLCMTFSFSFPWVIGVGSSYKVRLAFLVPVL
jgi:hypothetical protein